jgi:protein-tyrosine phosphatase
LLFREVELPDEATSALFLHSMPGRCEPLADAYAALSTHGVTHVICLVSMEEAKRKSRAYARDLERDAAPCRVHPLPICDRGIPADRERFLRVVRQTTVYLRQGERVLVHCGAGIGRTGMFATSVLMALGQSRGDAEARVGTAGSKWESGKQDEFLGWAERALHAEQA